MEPALLDTATWIAAGIIVLLAGLGHGVLGLGFPLLATPLLAIFLDIRSAVLITLLPTVTVNLLSIARGGRWSESIGRYWPLALMIPFGSFFGTQVLIAVDPSPLRLLLAALILLHLVKDRLRGTQLRWVHDHPRTAYLAFGFAAGFLAGTVNVMVPLLIIYALGIGMSPLVTVQVFNLCFLTGKLAQIGTFGLAGMLSAELVAATLPLAALAAAALLLGMRVRDRVDGATYRGWLRKALAVMALILVAQYLASLW